MARDSTEVNEPTTVCLILAESLIKSPFEHTWWSSNLFQLMTVRMKNEFPQIGV